MREWISMFVACSRLLLVADLFVQARTNPSRDNPSACPVLMASSQQELEPPHARPAALEAIRYVSEGRFVAFGWTAS
jgi:hypothetical protein